MGSALVTGTVLLGLALASTTDQPPPALEWLPDGSGVVVENRWIVDARTGQSRAITCAAPGCGQRVPALSPDGTGAILVDDGRVALGTLPGPLGPWMTIPRWIRAGGQDVAAVGFWLSADTPFVQQFDPQGEGAPACRSYDRRRRRWQKAPGGCLSPGFTYLARVDRGPAGLLALHSSAEGHFSLDIVRYHPAKGEKEIRSLVLEGASAVRVRFAPDGASADLVTPCPIEQAPPVPCGDYQEAKSWRLYALPVTAGPPRLRRDDLPPSAALHPRDERFAWSRGGELCIGDPKGAAPHCFPLPR